MWGAAFDVVSFTEAVDWFARRTPITDAAFRRDLEQAHRQAFWIAGVTRAEVIRSVFDDMKRALEQGIPYHEWQRTVGPKLEREWLGYSMTARQRAFRTELVLRNWSQGAYNRARWAQMNEPSVKRFRPYGLFDGVVDSHQSEICKACNGTCLPLDHPWWATHRPQLHHACRSGIRNLTKASAEARGITKRPTTVAASEGFGSLHEYKGPKKRAPAGLARPRRPRDLAVPPPPPEPITPPAPPPAAPVAPAVPATPAPAPIAAPPAPAPVPTPAAGADSYPKLGFTDDGFEKFAAASQKVFGRTLREAELLELVGYDDGLFSDATPEFKVLGSEDGSIQSSVIWKKSGGETVATLKRRYTVDFEGNRVADHQIFGIDDESQRGKGIGSRVVARQLEQYPKYKIKKVTLEADWDGPYVWSRAGWRVSDEDALEEMRERFADFVDDKDLPEKVAKRLKKAKSSHEIALATYDDEKLGKEFLREYGDRVEMELDVGSADYKKALAYFNRDRG